MSKKIFLIKPSAVFSKGRIGSISSTPPLGAAYLAACLREAGYEVGVIDGFGEHPTKKTIYPNFELLGLTNEEILERIPPDVDLFGFSCIFSNEWIYLKELIAKIKEKFPRVLCVLGGEHASALPEYSLKSCPGLDYVIGGEGEAPIVQFADAVFNAPEKVREVPGLSYRCENGIKTNPKGARVKELDSIPFPAWDLIPVENYLREGIATITRKGQRVMPMLASRGCPYACHFCSNPQMYGNRYYIRDIGEVIREIKFLRDRYQITGFELQDLTFIIKKPWVKEFCRRLIEEDLHMEWNVPTTRSEAIDAEVVSLLKQSGCKNLCLTPDSGSPEMIKKMLKNVDLNHVAQTARQILAADIILKMNIVFGFPGERHLDVWKSIAYGIKLAFLGVGSVLFYRFVPYPGSHYFNLLQKEGKLPPFGPAFDEFLIYNIYNELTRMKSYSENISNFWIRFYIFSGYFLTQCTFYLFHPRESFKSIKRIWKNSPHSQSDLLILALLRKFFRLHAERA